MKGNYYLYGRPFQWETDSTALVCFANLHSRDIAGPRGRLLQRLEQYQCDIKYIPRKRNVLADLGTNIPRHLTDAELIEELKQWPVMEDCMTVENRLRAALELAKTGIPKCLLTQPDGNIEEDEEVDSIQSGSGNLPAFTERQLSEFNVEHQPAQDPLGNWNSTPVEEEGGFDSRTTVSLEQPRDNTLLPAVRS
eukprot:Nk52_evm1s251 gene=Nk52_evmTU1s251